MVYGCRSPAPDKPCARSAAPALQHLLARLRIYGNDNAETVSISPVHISALRIEKTMMRRTTTLGMEERVERVLAYAFLWVSGLILFLFERNRNVRWHAAQSMVTFGPLSLLLFGVGLLKGFLGWIPIIGWLISPGLNLLSSLLWWATGLLWLWLMIMAWLQPTYRLPFASSWADALT